MVSKRRKYTKDFKIEIVEGVPKGRSILEVTKENEIYPRLITRWKRQYMNGDFHGSSASDIELQKPKLKIC